MKQFARNQEQSSFQFGAFELDPHSSELRKHGIRLKLQPQPLQILAILLECPGEVVTREEIQKRLWPDKTYVDFDNAINSAIRKLRDALGDTAENPRFIETLARRGYRFIYPISSSVRVLSIPLPKTPTRRRIGWPRVSAVGAAAVAVIALGFWIAPRRPGAGPKAGTLHRITSDAGLTINPAVSRDGTLLAYASDRGDEGHLHIWVQQLSGGEAIRLTHSPADDQEPSFSPDGTQIAFHSKRDGGGIYVVPSLGGIATLIAPQGRAPRFSPDGKWIAYWVGLASGSVPAGGSGAVYIVPATGGSPRLVSKALAYAAAPVWSPDGKYLLVVGEKTLFAHFAAIPDWWTLPLQGGAPICTGARERFGRHGLDLDPHAMPYATDWAADKILFSAVAGDSDDLWQVPIRSGTWQIAGKPERLTSSAGIALSPVFATGGRIVFASESEQTHLWMLPMDTSRGVLKGAPVQITDSAADEYWPSVSTDRTRLAFTSTRNGKEDIWLKNLKTGAETRIPSVGDTQEFPKFSHDGRRLAFTAIYGQHDGVEKASTYILSLDTMRPQKVLEKGDWVWDWSEDDRYLLSKWGAPRYVQLVDAASGHMQELLRDRSENVFQVTPSPDGRWLAFNGMSGIFVAPYQTHRAIPKQDWIRVTSGFFDDKPRWSPDGSRIYFLSYRDGWACLWVQYLDPETITPIGHSIAVYHSHSARRSIGNMVAPLADIAVSRDSVIFPQTELKSNIWMTVHR
ncbi:MAG TPA: winged helix-turn-helix domain-containing protein [Bryobacteraceae bacterium]